MTDTNVKIRRRGRWILMNEKDEADFTALLKEVFPEIVFACIDHSKRLLEYVPSIDKATDRFVYAMLSEPGWEPIWKSEFPNHPTLSYLIANMPEKYFWLLRSPLTPPGRVKSAGGMPIRIFSEGVLNSRYDLNNREVRAFIDKIYRLSTRILTNKFALIDPDTGTIVGEVRDWMYWGGRDALEQCRRERDVFLQFGRRDEAGRDLYFGPRESSGDEAATSATPRRRPSPSARPRKPGGTSPRRAGRDRGDAG